MEFVRFYHAEIDRVLTLAPGGDKFMHVQAGLLIWCLAALATRRSLAARLPLAVVIVAEIGNEIMDRLYTGSWRWHDTLGDAAATWAWPVALCLLLNAEHRRISNPGTAAPAILPADVDTGRRADNDYTAAQHNE